MEGSPAQVSGNARIAELEARNTALEEGVNNQKDRIQSIHEEHKEKLGAVESRHKAIRSVNIHLESSIMELQVCPVTNHENSTVHLSYF